MLYRVKARETGDAFDPFLFPRGEPRGILIRNICTNVLSNAVILLPSRARYHAFDVRALTQISYDFMKPPRIPPRRTRAFAKSR